MASEIAMPQMGVTMEAGTVLKWLKQVGDTVRKDEPVVEIETDKVTVEVPCDVEGVLLAIIVPEGKEVPVGTVLAWVGPAGEAVPGFSAASATVVDPPGANIDAPGITVVGPEPSSGPGDRVRATPAARSRARAYGVDLGGLRGTGPSGRILARDVETARSIPDAPSAAPATAAFRDLPVTGMRKVIAERMAQGFHGSVPVLLTTEIVVDRADDLLAQLGAEFRGKTEGKFGYLPLVVKAAAIALREHPRMNAHWLGDTIRIFEDTVNIGIAVSLEGGLAVPVLNQADRMELAEIAAGVGELAAKARQGSLAHADLEGGTFTVSNLGGYHIGFFMPVINPPQVAILGVGRVMRKPVVREEQVLALPVLPLSLVFDHRAVDGAPAAAFLDAIKAALEEPCRLLARK